MPDREPILEIILSEVLPMFAHNRDLAEHVCSALTYLPEYIITPERLESVMMDACPDIFTS